MEKKKILIIGDEPIIRHVITDELEKFGFHLSLAESCEEAWAKVAGGEIDCHLIIVDGVPSNDQETASFRKLKAALRENTPIMFLSNEKDTGSDIKKNRADWCLWKGSITPSTLLRTISELLELSAKMDRRRHRRHYTSLRVKFHGVRDFLYEYSENISRGGIFIVTEKSFPFRTPVDISIELPNSARHVKVIGEIVYSLSPGEAEKLQRKPGIGIQFVTFQDGTEKELDDYFRDLLDRESKPIPMGQVYVFYPEGEIHEQI